MKLGMRLLKDLAHRLPDIEERPVGSFVGSNDLLGAYSG
jgi:hypothetical protein